MKNFYIIESIKKRDHGHVSHLMVEIGDTLYELSPKTGNKMSRQNFWKLQDLCDLGYEIINPETATFTGSITYPFYSYLLENNLIVRGDSYE